MKCPKCKKEAECLAGRSAHPSNWYCSHCGWEAWDKIADSLSQLSPQPKIKIQEQELYEAAIDNWGADTQAQMAIGEMSELTAALIRFGVQGRGEEQDVIEEIADVEIMINQLKCIFDREKVAETKQRKLTRLAGILDGSVEHSHKPDR